jgi:hypothetical protein
MKKTWWRAAAAVLALGLILSAAAVKGEDASYWNKFKSVFVDWDDNAPAGAPQTQVAGVRGLGQEKALGNQGYNWNDVSFMEDFQVPLESEKAFLETAKLGPYQQ